MAEVLAARALLVSADQQARQGLPALLDQLARLAYRAYLVQVDKLVLPALRAPLVLPAQLGCLDQSAQLVLLVLQAHKAQQDHKGCEATQVKRGQ